MRKKLHTFLLYLIMAALVIGKNYGMFMHIFNDALQFATVKEILKQNRFLWIKRQITDSGFLQEFFA